MLKVRKKKRRLSMQFKEGMDVFTADGQKIGDVDRVVIDPNSKEITHLIIRKGVLFKKDKILPLPLVDTVTAEDVTLHDNADEMPELNDFEEDYYVSVADEEVSPTYPAAAARPLYRYPPPGVLRSDYYGGPIPVTTQSDVEKAARPLPEGTVPLQEDANVVTADGEHVGDVARVIADSDTNQVTHFVISKGLLLKEQKLIPVDWISSIGEEKIRLAVKSRQVDDLPPYEH
jgi:uncharacterized protein YrrD